MEKTREELKKAKEEASSSGVNDRSNDEGVDTKKEAANVESNEGHTLKEIDGGSTPKSTPKASKGSARKEAQSEDSKVKASSRSSTPCRELDHPQVDNHDVIHSSTGRIKRSRKKPTIYDPKTGPDSGWKGEETADTPSSATVIETKVETPAIQAETKPTPQKRGPKVVKKKKKKKKTKKAKKISPRKPEKKKIVPDTEGVGILNRLPGTLFDCSACLDIRDIKLCCYCACRVCFNKFGKVSLHRKRAQWVC